MKPDVQRKQTDLRHAMRLVDSEHRHPHVSNHLDEPFVAQSLGSTVEDLESPISNSPLDVHGFVD